jgi:hypothetical protein
MRDAAVRLKPTPDESGHAQASPKLSARQRGQQPSRLARATAVLSCCTYRQNVLKNRRDGGI